MKAGIKTRIDPASRALWIAKSKGVEAKLEPDESKRYDLALDCLASFMQMIEKSCELSDEIITKTFHGCDKAWKEFIRHCPSVIDGHKPTSDWFRCAVIQGAFAERGEATESLKANFEALGWDKTLEYYLDPTPTDPRDKVVLIEEWGVL